MPVVLLCLLALIGMTPVILLFDGVLIFAIGCALLAIALLVLGPTLRPGEAAHLGALVRPVAIVLAIPAILMLLQVMPLPLSFPGVNSMWQSAAAALARPMTGSISIDTGATLLSLCRYLAWLAIGLLAGALTIDRQRAEWVLFATTLVTVLIAAILVVNDTGGLSWLDEVNRAEARGGALDAAALGVILSAACIDRAFERFETRRARDSRAPIRLIRNVVICAVAFVVCAAAVIMGHSPNSLFAAGSGLATLFGFVLVRRLGFGTGGALSVAVLGCLIAVAIVGQRTNRTGPDFLLQFASQSAPSNAITQRMLADNTITGTGAGTYPDLVPIYRGPDDPASAVPPPSAAAEIAVEWGRPLFWLWIILTIGAIWRLLRAGLVRGRDSFYPATGASALVALLISAFGNPGLFGSAILTLAGTILGLALAQSRSRSLE